MVILKPKSVDEYIANAPKDLQNRLKQLRKIIKDAAPDAQEKISYGMPYYGYKGRLVYFAYAKNHIGLYAMPPTLEGYKNELKKYQTGKSTIRIPIDEKLPTSLIRKLVKAGVKRNDEKILLRSATRKKATLN